jgi:hypothetical protein
MWKPALFGISILAFAAGCSAGASQPAMPRGSAERVARATQLDVWTLHDATRLRPDSAARSGVAAIALTAARGETVSFQIAVRAPSGGLTAVTLSARPFASASASHAAIESLLFREYFVNVPHASPIGGHPRSLGAGIYPDGLIPFVDPSTGKTPPPSRLRAAPIALAAGSVQPYWIDVRVPSLRHPATTPERSCCAASKEP